VIRSICPPDFVAGQGPEGRPTQPGLQNGASNLMLRAIDFDDPVLDHRVAGGGRPTV